MYLNKSKADSVQEAINGWEESGDLDKETAGRLRATIQIASFDWKRLAAWGFYFAIACFAASAAALVAAPWFVLFLREIFQSDFGRLVLSASLSAVLYFYAFKLRQRRPERVYLNQAALFLAVLANAWAVGETGIFFSKGSGHFSLLFLLSCIIYALIGYFGKARLVWIFALLSFGAWMGAETGYVSGWGAYYLGMNYPLRFTLLGLLLTGTSLCLRRDAKFSLFFPVTLSVSLLYLFLSLWLLSIFGNYAYDAWQRVRQIELFHWSLLFAAAAAASFGLGLKMDIRMLRGYGLVFLAINLYTRFFEYFWDALDKALFFALLGLSLWLLAKRSENLWLEAEKQFGRLLDKYE
ncbi:MAG: hypothetical protein LBO03_09670 [Acidaminococcales bacterium]|nr:hypothetical protein [Acidaminococcales bacterium]